MKPFEIVAHRGIPTEASENTIESFQRALELGADAIELDVRLTSDQVPVVYHYFYLEEMTSASGAVFNFTAEQLQNVDVISKYNPSIKGGRISTLSEILERFGGKIGLEIDMKGPEPEAAEAIGNVLNKFKNLWNTIEVASYQPAMLLAIQKHCPGLSADLQLPHSESWMKMDVIQHQAVHYSRLAHARAVHLHPTQLSETIVNVLRHYRIDIHTWDVNDEQSLMTIIKFGIPRVCTDNFKQTLAFRNKISYSFSNGTASPLDLERT